MSNLTITLTADMDRFLTGLRKAGASMRLLHARMRYMVELTGYAIGDGTPDDSARLTSARRADARDTLATAQDLYDWTHS